jgi:SpoIID/LytB domain protein
MQRSPLSPLHRVATAVPAALLLLSGGCRAAQLPPPPPEPSSALQWPVPAPAPLDPQRPVLWVALAARLGPAAGRDATTEPPLRLVAASGSLRLIDAAGRRYMAPELLLHWQRQPLPRPLQIRRQVLGPFASYESADQAATQWRAQGVEPRIANPGAWEVWAAPDALPPPQGQPRLVERSETSALVLELRRREGAVRLEGPIRLEAPAGLRWGQGIYAGPFLLQADAHGGWSLVEQLPLERYLEGVVPHEIGAGAPTAALEAQAVLARTWALRNRQRFVVDGYHLCADTQCQVYSDPRLASAPVRAAIQTTRHQVLSAAGEPIHAVYHASNGGVAAAFDDVWSAAPLPYLRAFVDGPPPMVAAWPLPLAKASLPALLRGTAGAYGADHPRFRWQRTLAARRLRVIERGASGRVLALEIEDGAGLRVLRRDAIRRALRQLPSTLFHVRPAGPGQWLVEGGGFGHGAGLSQAGAIDLARRGWTTTRILAHYYPGTRLEPLDALPRTP